MSASPSGPMVCREAGASIIYGLRCPRRGVIRYIGKSDDPARRLIAHVRDARTGKTRYHHGRWLRSLLKHGLKPQVVALFVVPQNMRWHDAERFFVASAIAFGLPLANATRGGEGLTITNAVAMARAKASFRAAWRRPDVRAKRLAGMACANADPVVQALRSEKHKAASHRRGASVAKHQRQPEVRNATAQRFRALWAQPEMRERKREASRAVWAQADPAALAARRAAMSEGKRLGWARKKAEQLRRSMEWDTA